MIDNISKNYAEALFNIALKDNSLKNYKFQLNEIVSIYLSDKELQDVLSHPKISKIDKKEIINKIFSNNYISNITSFLNVLVDNNRFNFINYISEYFNVLVNNKLNIKKANIISAISLDEIQTNSIKKLIENRFNCELEFNFDVDSSLIAGIKVIVDGEVIDNSLSKNFNDLKNSLLER